VLLAPADGLRGDHLWTVEDGRLRRRPVRTGIRDLARAEVEGGAGVAEGAQVVLEDEERLAEGRRARPIEQAVKAQAAGGGAATPSNGTGP